MPSDCILAICSLPGLEYSHCSMLQVATVSPQPHLQRSRLPTRTTSAFGFSDAVAPPGGGAEGVCASAVATAASRRLLLNRCMGFGIAHHFSAGVLHFHFARHQT